MLFEHPLPRTNSTFFQNVVAHNPNSQGRSKRVRPCFVSFFAEAGRSRTRLEDRGERKERRERLGTEQTDDPQKINRTGLKSGRRSTEEDRGKPTGPFVETMMWIARTGSPWRGLPEGYPTWRSVYPRWRRRVRSTFWYTMLALLKAEHDPESSAVETLVFLAAIATKWAFGPRIRDASRGPNQ